MFTAFTPLSLCALRKLDYFARALFAQHTTLSQSKFKQFSRYCLEPMSDIKLRAKHGL